MTVKELRELLQEAPDNAEVWVGSEYDHPNENETYGSYTSDVIVGYADFKNKTRLLIGGINGNINLSDLASSYRMHLLTKDNLHHSDI